MRWRFVTFTGRNGPMNVMRGLRTWVVRHDVVKCAQTGLTEDPNFLVVSMAGS